MAITCGEDYRLKEDQCPVCLKKLDATTVVSSEKGKPNPGDYTVCLYCATVLRFGIGLTIFKATPHDLKQFSCEDPANFAVLGKVVSAVAAKIQINRRSRYRHN